MSSWLRRAPSWQKPLEPKSSTPTTWSLQRSLDPSQVLAFCCQRLRQNDDPLLTFVTLDKPDDAAHITQALLDNHTVQDVCINVTRFGGAFIDYRVLAGGFCESHRPNLLRLEPILHFLQATPQRQQDVVQPLLRKLELTCSFGGTEHAYLVDAILQALCKSPGSSDDTNNSNHRTVGQHIQELKLSDRAKASPDALERFLANAPSSLHTLSFDLKTYTPCSSHGSVEENEGALRAFSQLTSTITTLNLTSPSRTVDRVMTRVLQELNVQNQGCRHNSVINLVLDLRRTETSFPSRPLANHPLYQLSQHVMLERLTVELTKLSESDVASLELLNGHLPNLSVFHLSLDEPIYSSVLIQALGTCTTVTHVTAAIHDSCIEVWNSIVAAMRLRNVSTRVTIPPGLFEVIAELPQLPKEAGSTVKYAIHLERLARQYDCMRLERYLLQLKRTLGIDNVLIPSSQDPSHAMQNYTFLHNNDTEKIDLASLCCSRFDARVDAYVRQEHPKSLHLSSGSRQDTKRLMLFVRQNETLQGVRATGCTRHEDRRFQAMVESNCKLPLLLLRSKPLPLSLVKRAYWQPDTSTFHTIPVEAPTVVTATVTLMPRLVRAAMFTPRVSHRYVLAGMISLPAV